MGTRDIEPSRFGFRAGTFPVACMQRPLGEQEPMAEHWRDEILGGIRGSGNETALSLGLLRMPQLNILQLRSRSYSSIINKNLISVKLT
jgi:hypothetical protein